MKVQKLCADAILPMRQTKLSAGYDLKVPFDVLVHPGRNLIPLWISLELEENQFAAIEPRSGYSLKGFPDEIEEVCELSSTGRGKGGFGSTGA